jgi:hypothetical protein
VSCRPIAIITTSRGAGAGPQLGSCGAVDIFQRQRKLDNRRHHPEQNGQNCDFGAFAAQQGGTRTLRKFLLESSDFLAGQAELAPYRVGQKLKLSDHQARIPEGKVKLVPRIRWLIHRKRKPQH